MVREAKRVRVKSDHDISRVLDDVKADGEPRIVERDGEEVAAIVPVDLLGDVVARNPTKEGIRRALAVAGAWKDLDTTALEKRINDNRHASPPSAPVEL